MDTATADVIKAQNEVIVSLLARLSFGNEAVKEIVVEKKRDKDAYVKAYNALDGAHGVGDIAKLAKVDISTMSQVLKRWSSLGIVYNVGQGSKPAYKNVLAI